MPGSQPTAAEASGSSEASYVSELILSSAASVWTSVREELLRSERAEHERRARLPQPGVAGGPGCRTRALHGLGAWTDPAVAWVPPLPFRAQTWDHSLCFKFLTCEMGKIVVSPLQRVCESWVRCPCAASSRQPVATLPHRPGLLRLRAFRHVVVLSRRSGDARTGARAPDGVTLQVAG